MQFYLVHLHKQASRCPLTYEKLRFAFIGHTLHCSECVEMSPRFLCACKEWITMLDEFRTAMVSLRGRR